MSVAPPPAPAAVFPPRARRWVAGALTFVFANGLLAHSWAPLRPLALGATTPLLLLANAAVLWAVFDDHRARALRWWCLGAWAVTVILEMVGVATGQVFGGYHYGPTLRGQLAGVPLLIGLNWTTLLLGALALLDDWRLRAGAPEGVRWLVPVGAAVLLTAFDWILEPVAVALDYWAWDAWPHIPLRNFEAWFGIALGLGLIFRLLGLRVTTGLAQYYFALQCAFFVGLRLLLT